MKNKPINEGDYEKQIIQEIKLRYSRIQIQTFNIVS